jgi:hypothetical protein
MGNGLDDDTEIKLVEVMGQQSGMVKVKAAWVDAGADQELLKLID